MLTVLSESAHNADRPSPLLAVICSSVVESFDPSWLAGPVGELSQRAKVSRFRVSRLKAALLPRFDQCLADATRRGRRPRSVSEGDAKLAATQALLEVTGDLLGKMEIRGRPIQDGLVQAQRRLQTEHGLSQRTFCAALRLPERTFRYWVTRPPALPASEVPDDVHAPPRRRRDRNRGRFDLEVTLPGIQVMGDTTATELFGVDLKLVAVQDPGDRDQALWEAFEVGETENAQVVAGVVEAVAKDRPGLQLVTDQGKPFIAREAREAYERLGLEYAPQKEGTPTAKATLERSFGIVKPVLAPIIEWTRKLVEAAPTLRNTTLAKTVAGLLIAAVLEAYRLGRRESGDPGRSTDRALLRLVAEETREAARNTDRSRRLTLARIHVEYRMEGATETFVNAYRRYALEDIETAERALRNHACRCEVRRCDRYFAAILRRVSEEGTARRAKARKAQIRKRKDEEEERRYLAKREALRRDPAARVTHGLDLIATQWLPDQGSLLFNGRGIGHVDVSEGIATMVERLGDTSARDTTDVLWSQWAARRRDLGSQATEAIRDVLDRILRSQLSGKRRCADTLIDGIVRLRATGQTPRSPTKPLRT